MEWLLALALVVIGILVGVVVTLLSKSGGSRHHEVQPSARRVPDVVPDVFSSEKRTAYLDQRCKRHGDRNSDGTCQDCRQLFCRECLTVTANPKVDAREEARCPNCYRLWANSETPTRHLDPSRPKGAK